MKLKTAKGNIKILAEGQGGLLFQKQVSGEEWQQDIIDDNVLGGYYYNYANATYMPDELGSKSPWYRAMVQNTNNTIEGLRVVPYDRNTIYVNASAGSIYHHVSRGLSKISISSSAAADADYAEEAGHAIQAIYAEVAGGADILGATSADDEDGVVQGYSIGNSKRPVYFASGVPVACSWERDDFSRATVAGAVAAGYEETSAGGTLITSFSSTAAWWGNTALKWCDPTYHSGAQDDWTYTQGSVDFGARINFSGYYIKTNGRFDAYIYIGFNNNNNALTLSNGTYRILRIDVQQLLGGTAQLHGFNVERHADKCENVSGGFTGNIDGSSNRYLWLGVHPGSYRGLNLQLTGIY